MCWQKNSKALASPPDGELSGRRVPGEPASCLPGGASGISTYRYQSKREPRTALRLRIREIAAARIRYGYRKIRVLLKREGWQVGKKLVYRLREEGLTLRYKPRRRRCAATNRRERG